MATVPRLRRPDHDSSTPGNNRQALSASPIAISHCVDLISGELKFDFKLINNNLKPFNQRVERDIRSDHAGEVGAVNIYEGALKCLNSFPRGRESLITHVDEHLGAERCHLRCMEKILYPSERSLLTPLWAWMGFILGYLSTFLGESFFHGMVFGVERYVQSHYQHQIDYLNGYKKEGSLSSVELKAVDELLNILISCQMDEIDHKDDAMSSEVHRLYHTEQNEKLGSSSAAASKKKDLYEEKKESNPASESGSQAVGGKSRYSIIFSFIMSVWIFICGFGSAVAVAIAKRI